ncbi:hypothetical protein EON63_00535 [archaeon]|nr:MAG: hypothetical protein EON63_00535 [archaeon]
MRIHVHSPYPYPMPIPMSISMIYTTRTLSMLLRWPTCSRTAPSRWRPRCPWPVTRPHTDGTAPRTAPCRQTAWPRNSADSAPRRA